MTAEAARDKGSQEISGAIIKGENAHGFDVLRCLAIEERSAFAQGARGFLAGQKSKSPNWDSGKDEANE